jgi:hypothetical protein
VLLINNIIALKDTYVNKNVLRGAGTPKDSNSCKGTISMNIYNKRTPSKIYRKIYEDNFGPIPFDSNGRSYEIHHKDGDHSNNNPDNLIAVSIEEHYNIHFLQGDYRACAIIAGKMRYTPEEISKLNSLAAKKKVDNGTHPWLGDNNPSIKRIKDKTHLFLNVEWQKEKTRKSLENGTHNFLGGQIQRDRLEKGIHHFLGDTNPSVVQSKNGTHPWQGGNHQKELNKKLLEEGRHSTQWKWVCECGKEGRGKSNLVQHKRGKKCSLNAK